MPFEYFNALNDPFVIQYTEARHKRWSKEDAIRYLTENKDNGNSLIFSTRIRENSKIIGNVRIFNFSKLHSRCELSFLFFDKSEWGKGYATESVKAICDFCFYKMNFHRVHADYYAKNEPSSRVFQKLDFEIEGVYKDHFFFEGQFIDSIRVGLLKGCR